MKPSFILLGGQIIPTIGEEDVQKAWKGCLHISGHRRHGARSHSCESENLMDETEIAVFEKLKAYLVVRVHVCFVIEEVATPYQVSPIKNRVC